MRDPGLREDRRTEIKVGALVLLASVALVAGIFWITGTEVVATGTRVHGVAAEAGRMTGGARVFLYGVDVGQVEQVRLGDLRVLVDMRISPGRPLPADTRGVIRPAGFLGEQMVELVPGTSDTPLGHGDTIRLSRAPDLQSLAQDLAEDATTIIERVQEVLSPERVDEVERGSAALASAMEELEALARAQRETVGDVLANLESVSRRLAAATEGGELERAVARLDSLSARLTRASGGLDSTTSALASLTARLDRGEGTLGRMLTEEDLYEDLTAAVENLQFASEEVALLTRDLRERPERYLQGLRFSVF